MGAEGNVDLIVYDTFFRDLRPASWSRLGRRDQTISQLAQVTVPADGASSLLSPIRTSVQHIGRLATTSCNTLAAKKMPTAFRSSLSITMTPSTWTAPYPTSPFPRL